MPAESFSTRDFAVTFKAFLEEAVGQAPVDEPPIRKRIRVHLGVDPAGLPVISEEFQQYEHPNLQIAIDSYLDAPGRSAEVLGLPRNVHTGLAELAAAPRRGVARGPEAAEGPVAYLNVKVDEDRMLPCVEHGLFLVSDGDSRLVVLMRGGVEPSPFPSVRMEVIASQPDHAGQLLSEVRASMREHNVYRGRVLSLSAGRSGLDVNLHSLPRVERSEIVLPDGVLERIERHTIGFARQAARLAAAGRHLKRGLLLHGAPGTGKTLTVKYLAGQSPERTVLLLTGRGLGLMPQSCALARDLQPSTIVLEDVDLIAEERTHQSQAANTLLFQFLNELDGLAEDADVMFVMTTNRPQLLEPALAARPGRVDQAIELPLPDARCRAQLFELYGQGLDLHLEDLDRLVERTEGVPSAFIRELLRKAALRAAEETDDRLVVNDLHLDEALHDMVVGGGELTKSLLGMRPPAAGVVGQYPPAPSAR